MTRMQGMNSRDEGCRDQWMGFDWMMGWDGKGLDGWDEHGGMSLRAIPQAQAILGARDLRCKCWHGMRCSMCMCTHRRGSGCKACSAGCQQAMVCAG